MKLRAVVLLFSTIQPMHAMNMLAQERLNNHLFDAINADLYDDVERLIKMGAHVNARDNCSRTPLILAVTRVNPRMCKIVLDAGAKTNLRDAWKDTALTEIASFDETSLMGSNRSMLRKEVCELIVRHQRQINATIKTALLTLNRLKDDESQNAIIQTFAETLYRHFRALLLPYLGNYVPLKKLLNMRNEFNMRACDYYPLECLNPDAESDSREADYFLNYSIQ